MALRTDWATNLTLGTCWSNSVPPSRTACPAASFGYREIEFPASDVPKRRSARRVDEKTEHQGWPRGVAGSDLPAKGNEEGRRLRHPSPIKMTRPAGPEGIENTG